MTGPHASIPTHAPYLLQIQRRHRNLSILSATLATMFPVGMIFLYYKLLISKHGKEHFTHHDVMNIVFHRDFLGTGVSLGFWSTSHVLHFCVLMLLSTPDYATTNFMVATVVGIVWEFLEDYVFILLNQKKTNDFRTKHGRRNVMHHDSSGREMQYAEWWSGSKADIVCNTCGMLLGVLTRKMGWTTLATSILTTYVTSLLAMTAHVNMHVRGSPAHMLLFNAWNFTAVVFYVSLGAYVHGSAARNVGLLCGTPQCTYVH